MIDHLRSILKLPDTVLFVGSGTSLWSGLPSWGGLISELSDFIKSKGLDPSLVDKEANKGELLQAASYGFDKLTKQQIGEFIRKACRLGITKPHEIHEKLISLGPRCYVTTNYDKLLELSFQKWQPDKFYRTVINKQLAETAEIVGARSTDFLFKLHGDAEDSESIILTREQYRSLNQGGELYHALETVRMLQVSRPFVYIGFGLRDPDFLYVRDLLANTYKGGSRDHYAIMADITEEETDYWRRNFGIHLISYKTIEKPDGGRDHGPLLLFLDQLCDHTKPKIEIDKSDVAEFVLNLARHAARCSRLDKPSLLIPLVIHSDEARKRNSRNLSFYRFEGESVETLLDNGPEKLILTGLPGSGKSFAAKHSASRLAADLNNACMEEVFKPQKVVVPIFADLKLYKGNVFDLVESTLPVGVKLNVLLSSFKVKIYLDAFNEMPREYIEANIWDADFLDFLKRVQQASIIITSRTSDGMEKLEMPIFSIDLIKREFIESYLSKKDIELTGLFKNEIFSILQRPFFYKLLSTDIINITSDTNPRKIYSELLALINSDFQKRFEEKFNLIPILSDIAQKAIDNGEEAFKLEQAKTSFQRELTKCKIEKFNAEEIINWLIGRDFIIPIVNERISFFHQSITEYLSAANLAIIYETNPKVLKSKLSFRRWDQALFLALSLLEEKKAKEFLKAIIAIDFDLALSAVKYMEYDKDVVVERLLLEIEKNTKSDQELMFSIADSLESVLPISFYHIPTLKNIIKLGNSVGGAAVSRIIRIKGDDFKEEAFELLVNYCNDFNFCSTIGRELKEYITEEDLSKIVDMANRVQGRINSKQIKECEGFESAVGEMLEHMDPYLVYKTFFDPAKSIKEQKIRLSVLCDFLQIIETKDAFKIAFELLLLGVDEAVFPIYLIAEYSEIKHEIDWSSVTNLHIKTLLKIIKNKRKDNANWALDSLKKSCLNRNDLISVVIDELKNTEGILKAALLYSITENKNYDRVFEALESTCKLINDRLNKEPFSLLSHMELDWRGHETLFLSLLKLRNIKLAEHLCDSIDLYGESLPTFILDIGPIEWWLQWLLEVRRSNGDDWIFEDRVSRMLANSTSNETKKLFLDEFNNPNTIYRQILAGRILKHFDDLTIESLNEDAILYLLEDLKNYRYSMFQGNLLESIATESFVYERLLPLLSGSKDKLYKKNLASIIESIGKRHGRRYNAL